MKIAVHIAVKDEVELFSRCIAHLREIGVSQFIICEMQSTDGTAELVESMKSDDFIVFKSSNSKDAHEWLRLNTEAILRAGADWTICQDADEFLLPAGGKLVPYLESVAADVVSLPRYNVPLTPGGPRISEKPLPETYKDIDLIVQSVPQIRKVLEDDPDMPWIRVVPAPKTIVRTEKLGSLDEGMHRAFGRSGHPMPHVQLSGLVMAHVPFTSLQRFRRKLENIREAMKFHSDYFGPDRAWHWRRWLQLADEGKLDAEFERSQFSDSQIVQLRESGIIRSVADMLSY